MSNEAEKNLESRETTHAEESASGGSPAGNEATDAAVAESAKMAPAPAEASPADEESPSPGEAEPRLEDIGGAASVEELIDRKVAEKVSSMFPQKLEAPRVRTPREPLAADDYLRLGYGTRSPHV